MLDLLEILGLKSDAEPEVIKTFIDRLKPAAYTSPSGIRTEVRFSDALEKTYSHKLDEYTYNGIDGSLIQDLGVSGTVYPLVCFLAGNDYDKESTAFEQALSETGVGTLEHPIYGRKKVVVATVRRQDDPVNGGGIGAFTIEFRETLEFNPSGVPNASALSEALLDTANEASALEFSSIALNTIGDIISFTEDILGVVNTIANVMDDVISASSDAIVTFNQIKRDIETNISTIVNFPDSLARQIQLMTQLSVGTGSNAGDALISLSTLVASVGDFDIASPSNAAKNRSMISELVIGAAVNSATLITQQNTYSTKNETFEAIEALDAFIIEASEIADSKMAGFDGSIFEKQYFSQVDSFQEVIALAVNVKTDLQIRAFDAKIERRFITKRDYPILELCGALYSQIDDESLDFFISTNGLEDDEYFDIPSGREIVFYV